MTEALRKMIKTLAFFTLTLASLTATAEITRAVTEESGDNCVSVENGEPSGICINLWKQIARELNIKYEIKAFVNPDQSLAVFKNKSVDIVIKKLDDIQMDKKDISE